VPTEAHSPSQIGQPPTYLTPQHTRIAKGIPHVIRKAPSGASDHSSPLPGTGWTKRGSPQEVTEGDEIRWLKTKEEHSPHWVADRAVAMKSGGDVGWSVQQ